MKDRVYDNNNIFAKIIEKSVPADIIYEDDNILSFFDIHKAAKIHAIVIPKSSFTSYRDFVQTAQGDIISDFFKKIDMIADMLGIADSYKLITNHGSAMGQAVFHFHVHLLGGGLIKHIP